MKIFENIIGVEKEKFAFANQNYSLFTINCSFLIRRFSEKEVIVNSE